MADVKIGLELRPNTLRYLREMLQVRIRRTGGAMADIAAEEAFSEVDRAYQDFERALRAREVR